MIEVIFDEKHEEEFRKAIKEATYYSLRTRVVVLPDDKEYLVPSNSFTNTIRDDKPYLRVDGKNFYIDNAPHDLLYYMEVFMDYGNAFSFKLMGKLATLIDNNILDLSEEFKNTFCELNDGATFSDLECSKYKFRVNKKNQGFENVLDLNLREVFSDVVKSDSKNRFENIVVTDIFNMKDKKGSPFVEVFGFYKNYEAENEEDSNVAVTYRVYGNNNNLKKILSNNKKIRVELDENNKVLGIVPSEIVFNRFSGNVSPSKESKKKLNKLPVMLFRMAYYEYIIRNVLKF